MKGLLCLHQEHAVEWHHLLRGESTSSGMNRMTIDFIFAFGMGLGKKKDDEKSSASVLPRSHDSHVGRDGRLVAAAPRQSRLAVLRRLRCRRRRRNVGRRCRCRWCRSQSHIPFYAHRIIRCCYLHPDTPISPHSSRRGSCVLTSSPL